VKLRTAVATLPVRLRTPRVIGPRVANCIVDHEVKLRTAVGDLAGSNGGSGHRGDQVSARQHE
jgi:hypothetical protein